jgi:hypothetical protein
MWSQVFSSLATPVIAASVAYIAWRQWRTAHLAMRERLFDRRFQVFDDVHRALSRTLASGDFGPEECAILDQARQKAVFLFGKEIQQHLLELRKFGNQLHALEARLRTALPQEERLDLLERRGQVFNLLSEQLDPLHDQFRAYLAFDKI